MLLHTKWNHHKAFLGQQFRPLGPNMHCADVQRERDSHRGSPAPRAQPPQLADNANKYLQSNRTFLFLQCPAFSAHCLICMRGEQLFCVTVFLWCFSLINRHFWPLTRRTLSQTSLNCSYCVRWFQLFSPLMNIASDNVILYWQGFCKISSHFQVLNYLLCLIFLSFQNIMVWINYVYAVSYTSLWLATNDKYITKLL